MLTCTQDQHDWQSSDELIRINKLHQCCDKNKQHTGTTLYKAECYIRVLVSSQPTGVVCSMSYEECPGV